MVTVTDDGWQGLLLPIPWDLVSFCQTGKLFTDPGDFRGLKSTSAPCCLLCIRDGMLFVSGELDKGPCSKNKGVCLHLSTCMHYHPDSIGISFQYFVRQPFASITAWRH